MLQACASSGISPEVVQPEMPTQWQAADQSGPLAPVWAVQRDDQRLMTLISEAFNRNFNLGRQAAELEAARQQVVVSGAPLYP